MKGNEFFCEVEEDFIQDDFNLAGLSSRVPYYEYALDTILDVESPASASFSDEQQEAIENAAELLYGLIHARFAITPRGMGAMLEKYKAVHFGRCPRLLRRPARAPRRPGRPAAHAHRQALRSKCRDIFYPRSSRQANIDGAYFSTVRPPLPPHPLGPRARAADGDVRTAHLRLQDPQERARRSEGGAEQLYQRAAATSAAAAAAASGHRSRQASGQVG